MTWQLRMADGYDGKIVGKENGEIILELTQKMSTYRKLKLWVTEDYRQFEWMRRWQVVNCLSK